MAIEATETENRRIENSDEFRRKKRNCLAIGTLGIGFALADTQNAVSFPGMSDTKISSWALGIGILIYLIYTTWEYYHEYRHEWILNSALAKRFNSDKTALSAIESLKKSIEVMDESFRSILWTQISDNNRVYTDIGNAVLGMRDRYNSLVDDYDEHRASENFFNFEKIRIFLSSYRDEVNRKSDDLKSLIDSEPIITDNNYDQRHQVITRSLEELKNLVERNALPSARALTTLSNTLHRSDRILFIGHDGIAPFALAAISGVALALDIAMKIILSNHLPRMGGLDVIALTWP